MASTGTQPAPSTSSSSTHRRKYEVFLSFRGDTRYEFTDFLFEKLKRMGIIVFRDNESLRGGEEINPALKAAIEESRNAAVIISPGFTESKACLFELTVIMECWQRGHLAVFPVFYHINPSNVRKLTKDFKNHFDTLKDDPKDDKEAKWEYWKSLLDKIADWSVDPKLDEDPVESIGRALKKLSDISAWVVSENSYIIPIIDGICQAIWDRTISDSPNISESLVGIESPISNIMQLLDLERENEVRLIGICGMGGIGKSTLAEVIYEKVSPQFDARYFSNPIGKKENKDYLVSTQEKLIYNILPDGAANLFNNAYKVKDVLRTKLRERKVFIVLDDLWFNTQVKELAEDLNWFGPGSRIIITSRNHDLLHLCEDNIYEVEKLNKNDALKLFCLKAFKQPQPKKGFERLSDQFVRYAEGLPLVLDTCGASLSNKKDKKRWHGYLKELHDVPNKDILSILQKSVEELDGKTIYPEQVFPLKELFLDIACFFNGYLKDDVFHMLNGVEGFGTNLEHYLTVLKEKSLLRISNDGILWMHDLLVDLGQEMASTSRLVRPTDIIRVLETWTVTPKENPKVKGIVLDLSLQKRRTFHLEALSTMVNLRVLHISYYNHDCDDEMEESNEVLDHDDEVGELDEDLDDDDDDDDEMEESDEDLDHDDEEGEFDEDLNHVDELVKWNGDLSRFKLSAKLHIMSWMRYPFQSLPEGSNFVPTKLVMLILVHSHINQLWNGQKCFPELRHMDLRSSKQLIEIPDMSQVPNLETLDLSFCHCLSVVHSSVGGLKRLKILCASSCHKLEQFPNMIISKCLEVLDLYACWKLRKFPNIQCCLPVLRHLNVSKTNFEEHPFLSAEFPSLESFGAEESNMKELPSRIAFSKKLRRLRFSYPTSIFQLPTRFSDLSTLEFLILRVCYFSDETELIDLRGLSSLKYLDISGNNLKKAPDIISELSSLNKLNLDFSKSLRALPKLPLSLDLLSLCDCPLLETFDSEMTQHISREMLRTSGCSSTVAYIGFEGKPYKILNLHPESPPNLCYFEHLIQHAVACGPMQASRIPSSFIRGSISSSKTIQIPMDWNSDDGISKPWACALLIFYEVSGDDEKESRKRKFDEHDNLDTGAREGGNDIFPVFVCQLQLNEGSPEHTFIICVPEVAHVGSHGLWVCINNLNSCQESQCLERWSCQISITSSSRNVVLRDGGAHLLNRDAHLELANVIIGLDSQTLALAFNKSLTVDGPIKPWGEGKGEKEKEKIRV